MEAYLIATMAVVAAYLLVLMAGHKTRLWRRLRLSLVGPVMVIRTQRGRAMIERAARARRLWNWFGSVAICITVASALLLSAFLLFEAVESAGDRAATGEAEFFGPEETPASPPTTAVYVVVGFAAAIVVHEFAHGVMATAARIRLLSTGVLLLVVPIGAFVEPDDEELKKAPGRSRQRLYASGPASNLIAAGVFLVVLAGFVGPAMRPVSPGALVTDIADDSPAALYGIEPWDEIVSVGGAPVLNGTQMRQVSFAEPGEPVSVKVRHGSILRTVEVPGGVVIHAVFEGPGHDAGLRPGMIVRSVNHTLVNSVSEFRSATENASRHEPVEITVLSFHAWANGGLGGYSVNSSVGTVNLTSKWLYYWTHYPWANRDEYKNVSFMAVSVSPLGVWTEDPEYLSDIVARPFGSVHVLGDVPGAFRDFVGLPFAGFSPISSHVTYLYEPGGFLAFMPSGPYWVLLNLLYWLFWANLMLGLTNALPALPLDGGYLVRDLLRGLSRWRERRIPGLDRTIGRRLLTEERVDDMMLLLSGVLAFIVAYLLLAGPLRSLLGA